jgi:hypothetical protein
MEKPPTGKPRTKAQREKDTADVIADLGPSDKGAKGGDRYEHVQRDIEIYRAHLRGIDRYDLAQTYGLTPDTVTRIVKGMRDQGTRISELDPVEVIEDIAAQIDAGISEIAAVAAREKGSVRVSAVLGRINALIQKGKWLQQAGVLPQEAQELNVHVSQQNLSRQIYEALERENMLTPELIRVLASAAGQADKVLAGTAEELPAGEVVEAEVVEDRDAVDLGREGE